MPNSWFELNDADKLEVLEQASPKAKQAMHLVEKDIWVVWTLSVLYSSFFASSLTFKGGTSLSKVYRVIDRFSEDIDLTYDIRELVADILRDGEPIPMTKSHEKKISTAVRERLPIWVRETVYPLLEQALHEQNMTATLVIPEDKPDVLLLQYPSVAHGYGYVSPAIKLEFGARATGEPNQSFKVECDAAPWVEGVSFPTAQPLVMSAERTFWEKATAAHVYCLQGKRRGEGYSRHWFDLVALANSEYFQAAINNHDLAAQVAAHKNMFFTEKDSAGNKIDYHEAVSGNIQLVPKDEPLKALELDYQAMCKDRLLYEAPPSFDVLIQRCGEIENEINGYY